MNNYQDITKDELIIEFQKLQQEYNSLNDSYLYDISMRKLAEQELIKAKELAEDNERKFKSIIESQAEGISFINQNEIFEFVNYASAKIFETETEDLIGASIYDFLEPEEIEKINNQIHIRKRGITDSYDLKIITKKNNTKFIHVTATPKFDENGDYLGAYGVFRDITERKLAEEALLESEWKFNALFEKGPIGVAYHEIISDASGKPINYRFIDANQAYLELTGVDPKGKLVTEAFPGIENDPFDWIGTFGHVAQTGESIRFEQFLQSNSRWYDCVGYQYKPNHFVAAFLEITKRKLAEAALRKTEAIQHKMVANIGDVIVIVDQYGINRYKSPNIEKWFGWRPEEVVGSNTYDLIHPDDLDSAKKFIKGLIDTPNATGSAETRYRCKDGRYKWIEITMVNLLDDPDIMGFLGNYHDITERKETEEKISMFAHAIRSIGESVCIADLNDNILFVNSAFLETYEYEEHELIGKNISIVRSHNNSGDVVSEIIPVTLKGGWHGELINKRSDGSEFPIFLSTSAICNEKGQPVAFIGVTTDITERKQSEEALKKSEEKLRTVFNTMEEGLALNELVYNEQGEIIDYRILEVNMAFEKIVKLHYSQVVGKLATDIYGLTAEYINDFWKHHKNDYRPIKTEVYNEQFDTWKYVSTSRPIENKFVTSFFDITDRKKAESQLILLSRAVEQSPVSVIITDKNGDVQYVNPKFTEVTGYSLGEIKGKNQRILKSGNQTNEFYENLWHTILSGENWYGEFHNKKKNGELYWESAVISSIVNSKGDISSFVAVKEDITEKRKMLEDLIIAKELAEESNNLKTVFLNNISHEIRTPFTGILGFLKLIIDDELPADERIEYVNLINQCSFRLMNTINDIVEISQIQAGQMKVAISDTNILQLINELFKRYNDDAESKGLKFTINNDFHGSEVVYTDRKKLNTILTNLIVNAIKFTKTGSVEFGVRMVDNNEILFFVKDTGIGIPKDKQLKIFDFFMQADDADTRSFEGSGLGLAISKAYIEMLEGKIWVVSNSEGNPDERGSVFYFTIPYKIEQEEENNIEFVTSGNNTDNQLNKLKILIAEDDEGSAMLMEIAVKTISKQIFKVRTGVEAIEVCRNNPDIDLILMDIKMPVMDGYEATRQIRNFNEDVIIIAQTAYALIGDKEKSIAAGCDNYIAKPIMKEKLLALISNYF